MRIASAFALIGSFVLLASSPGASAGDSAPDGPVAAVAAARPLLEAAKTVRPSSSTKEGKEAAAGVLQAYAFLKPHQKEGTKLQDFRILWNELVTLGRFHGLKAVPTEYQFDRQDIPSLSFRFSLPVGRGWDFRAVSDSGQCRGMITKTVSNDRIVRYINILAYEWTSVYVFDDGVQMPGENEKGIAEEWLKRERNSMSSVKRRSNEVAKGRIGKGMPKAYTYEIVGTDKESRPVRRRLFFTKASLAKTLGFEVVENHRPGIQDDPWTEYQTLGEPDYELEAILDTFVDTLAGK